MYGKVPLFIGRGITMAKLKFKPTPAGILFLSAIGVLLIAIIILTVVGISRCKKTNPVDVPEKTANGTPEESIEPEFSFLPLTTPNENTPDPNTSADPNASADPNNTANPNTSADPNASAQAGTSGGPGPIVITTPGNAQTSASPGASATPSPSPKYYTAPTSHMKKHAQKGHVTADGVNMRKTPNAKTGTIVKSKIAKNTALTLYVEQEGWWFVKCGDKYGYIKKDYVAKGAAPKTPAPTKIPIKEGEARGKVRASVIALRKSPDESSDCIKQYYSGEQLVIYFYVHDSAGRKWYNVKTSDGKKGYMFAAYVTITEGTVGAS